MVYEQFRNINNMIVAKLLRKNDATMALSQMTIIVISSSIIMVGIAVVKILKKADKGGSITPESQSIGGKALRI